MSGRSTAQEQSMADGWARESFQFSAHRVEGVRIPLSFNYDGQDSKSLLGNWSAEWTQGASTQETTVRVLLLTDPRGRLQCRCQVTTFHKFPAVEWVVFFRNIGNSDTPIIADIQPLDAFFPTAKDPACRVHHAKGSQCRADDFEPLETPLKPPSDLNICSVGGRSSDGALPFFNLETGDRGIIGAVGWTGGWTAQFHRGDDGRIQVRAGMEETHLKLLPGEEIRTPRILLLFWEQDRLHGHNMLRQFILAHHTPRMNNELIKPPISDGNWGERRDKDQIAKMKWLAENDIPIEYFWIDAGWHGDGPYRKDSTDSNSDWWRQVGNWYPNKITYPRGLKPVGDSAKAHGFGFVLWLEPERVFQETQYTREHPEWLLGPVGTNYLFNLGIPEARRYLTDAISALISEARVTCYRQDFNTNPAPFWKAADAPDRIGMSEIRHIEGLYAFWDELRARHPGLIIDNCSSGGRRIDLEMISRSVPLWRSDAQCTPGFDPIVMQTQTQGLAPWVPLSTGSCQAPNTYAFRSAHGPGIVLDWSTRAYEKGEKVPVELCRKLINEMRAVRKYFYGDFYPILSFSFSDDVWAAWQFDRPDLGEGMILALRRPKSPFIRMEPPLRGLEPEARYEVRSLDSGSPVQMSGHDLLRRGIGIEISDQPGSALLVYRRMR